ncbi:uncharacterized protein LOC113147433 [Cyclospora cayetanensis]|uniref:Uncharacterized protein LOC113147433 n=1 Tax=Cyclospora cayetanensis TaxID=88456 RepID=A0A6P6S0W2_9EIME|nr:uncharacterized protein LOC113147433 [Cyclospora cayetanensis]
MIAASSSSVNCKGVGVWGIILAPVGRQQPTGRAKKRKRVRYVSEKTHEREMCAAAAAAQNGLAQHTATTARVGRPAKAGKFCSDAEESENKEGNACSTAASTRKFAVASSGGQAGGQGLGGGGRKLKELYSRQQQQKLPRLSVQKTFIVRNPINIAKTSLKATLVDNRVSVSFRFDSLSPLEVRLFFFPTGLANIQDVAPPCLFASRPRRFGVGLQQQFEATPEESPLAADCLAALQAKSSSPKEDSPDTCDLLIQLQALTTPEEAAVSAEHTAETAAGAAAQEGVRQQLTFAAFVPQNSPERRCSEDNCPGSPELSSLGSGTAAAAAAAAARQDSAPAVWRLCVLKQKVELGSRSFEVQEIFGIDGGSGVCRRPESSSTDFNVKSDAGVSAADAANPHCSSSDDHLSGR